MKQYTFDDWVGSVFFYETDMCGQQVKNDSTRYLDLVKMGKMDYKTLHNICDAQAKTYEYWIQCKLYFNHKLFMDRIKESMNQQKTIEIKIQRLEKELNESEKYYEVILPRKFNDIKIGATYITPAMYLAYQKDKKRGNGILFPDKIPSKKQKKYWYYSSISALADYPTLDQKRYAEIEVGVLWLNKLRGLVREIEGDKNIQDIEDISIDKRKKSINDYGAKYYALAYFFDCVATDNRKYENQTQGATESDLYQYSNGKRATSTIRKALDSIKVKENKLFNNNTLIDDYGTDWRTKIIELSKYPEKVEAFLQSKRL